VLTILSISDLLTISGGDNAILTPEALTKTPISKALSKISNALLLGEDTIGDNSTAAISP